MKNLLSALLLALVFAGCAKNLETENEVSKTEKTKYAVNFVISDFGVTKGQMSTSGNKTTLDAGDVLSDYADNLYYRIYNANGICINGTDQTRSSSAFGTIVDALPSGTYTVSIIAAKGTLIPPDKNNPLKSSTFFPSNSVNNSWNDTFFKTFTITVGTSAITQSVRLDRVVAGVEVVLEDAIAPDAAKISVIVNPDWPGLSIGRENTNDNTPPVQKITEFVLQDADKGVKSKSFLAYAGRTMGTESISIKAYNAAGNVIAEKTIPTVTLEKGVKTTLTGSLFNSVSNPIAGFSVAVNPIWGTTTTPPIRF
jgi:hypothetical protein